MRNNSRSIGSLKTYDARTKLYILCMYLLMAIISWKLIPVIIFAVGGIAIVFLCRLKTALLWDMSKSACLIELIIGLLMLLFISPIYVIYIVIKLIMLTFVFNGIMACIKQVDMLDGLMRGFRMKVSPAKTIYSLVEYFPEVYSQKRRVRSALMARGVDPDSGNIFRRFWREIELAVPNHANAYNEIKDRMNTMDMRCFTSARRRSRIDEMSYNAVDYVVIAVMVILVLATIWTLF